MAMACTIPVVLVMSAMTSATATVRNPFMDMSTEDLNTFGYAGSSNALHRHHLVAVVDQLLFPTIVVTINQELCQY